MSITIAIARAIAVVIAIDSLLKMLQNTMNNKHDH
jgi:hypothetical protein